MDSLGFNKGAAAILVAGIAFMLSGVVADGLVHPKELAQSAIKIEGAAEPTAATKPAEPVIPPIAPLLASASVERGQADVQKLCSVCHSFNEGGPTKVGPNLYGIVGDKRDHMPGFNYSDGLRKLGGEWTYENLNHWLFDPRLVVADTRMAFGGISNDKERADVIDYLHTLSPHPLPLPNPEAMPAPLPPKKS
jgi:cytochrome c